MNLLTKQKRDSQTQKTNLWLPGGRDSQGLWEGHVHTAVFKMNSQERPIVQHMELYSMLCGRLDGRGVWGRMEMCACACACVCVCVCAETIITL